MTDETEEMKEIKRKERKKEERAERMKNYVIAFLAGLVLGLLMSGSI